MPSPFPGMDPWLENRVLWQGFHNVYIAECMRALNHLLPESLVATCEVRIRIMGEATARPDIGIVNRFVTRPNVPISRGSAVAVADRMTAEPLTIRALPEHERQAFITIRDTLRRDTVVTVIELMSPSNKRGRGYEEYRSKQAELLQSETALVEIDFLRGGRFTVAVPEEELRHRELAWDFLVCSHDVTLRWDFRVWPLTLRHKLPQIPIPLGSDFIPVTLDLQALFDDCYDTGRYGSLLDYSQPPEVPLNDEDVAWATALLASR